MKGSKRITLGILAHVDAGKTTLAEALLYKAGEIRKPGRVDHGDAFLDNDKIERNRGITIFSRQARLTLNSGSIDTEVTLIDTPGHVDFAAEMERSLAVLDCALLVISGSEGVQAHTKTLYGMLRERGIPVFIFINKMDIAIKKPGDIISQLSEELAAPAVDFAGAPLRTDGFIDAVTLYSAALAERVLETDAGADEGSLLTDKDIAAAVMRGEIVPVMMGSALKIEGIDALMDVLSRYTYVPVQRASFGAKVYKVAKAGDGERLCFIKITGGGLKARDSVKVTCRDGTCFEEKVNQIRLYSGSRCEKTAFAEAGTVCAVTGLSRAAAGDALGDEEPLGEYSVRPFMTYSVAPPPGMDPHDLMNDLQTLTEEDPALAASWGEDGSIELRLMGQVQLEVLTAVLKERFGYDAEFGTGRVLYLETVSGTYEGMGHFEPLRHYAEVHVIVEPGERGSGIVITSDVPTDELSVNWQRLILTNLGEKEHRGVLTGAPLTDVKITLAAGRAHEKHTSGGDFREASYRAVRHALMQSREAGGAVLLEPWCRYEISAPAGSIGRAMADIKQMGGVQDDLEQTGKTARIRGRVPAAEIAAYQLVLADYTSGEGRVSLAPCGYDICHDAPRVIECIGYDPESDIENTADSVFVDHGGSDIVNWREASGRMHIMSVLGQRKRQSISLAHAGTDPKEAARRRAASEKELMAIFERTYGAVKRQTPGETRRVDFRRDKEMSEEEAAHRETRSREIKARHEHKTSLSPDEPALMLIDGYNLIFADEYLKELAERDIGSARDQLIDRLSNYAGYTGLELAVIFDAYRVAYGEVHEETISGIRVVYTAQDETADIRMGRMAAETRGRRIYVVTSDRLVQQDARIHGALLISSREFKETLARTEEEIRSLL